MKALSVLALSAALAWTFPVRAVGQVDKDLQPSLRFLQTLSTPMPDPAAPSWYSQVPDSGGMMRDIGHSGWVRGYFSQMRQVAPKFLAMDQRLRNDVNAYTDTVRVEGEKVLGTTTGLQKALKDLDRTTSQRLQELLAEYNKEVTATRNARSEYQAALSSADEAKYLLEARSGEDKQCNLLLDKSRAEAKKAALLARLQSGRAFLDTVEKAIKAMADGPQAAASYVTGELRTRTIDAAKTILVEAFYSGTREALYELTAKIEALDTALAAIECKPQAASLKAAKANLDSRLIQVLLAYGRILEHRGNAWGVVDRLGTLQATSGRTVPFLANLKAYNTQVNARGRRVFDSINAYLDFLAQEPLSRGEIVLRSVAEDIAMVEQEKQRRDPSGKWLAIANDARGYLGEYTKWYNGELRRGENALADLREGRHLEFVDRMVARAIRELGGTVSYGDIIR